MRHTLKATTVTLGAIGLASLAYASFGVAGCVITTTDEPIDTGVVTDTGVPVDTYTPPPDTPGSYAVIIPAKGLTTSTTAADEIHDFGGGSTKADILTANRIYNAIGAVGTVESTPIGKDDKDNLIDGRITGLAAGVPVTITVTGYLRGLNGSGPKNTTSTLYRIPWAKTTCTATPSATGDVTATCGAPLKLLGTELDGVVFTSDVLPTGYCAGKGVTGFDDLRARVPDTGAAVASIFGTDCDGVVFIPAAQFTAAETAGVSYWRLALETKGAGTACTLKTPCKVDRSGADTIVVGSECLVDATSTGNATCF